MKKLKSFLNPDRLKLKTPEEIEVERQLLPRLKFMGILLFAFGGCALCYSLFFAPETLSEISELIETDGTPLPKEMEYASGLSIPTDPSYGFFQIERYNGYIIAFCFTVVGAICFLTAWNKQKKLPAPPEDR